MTENKRFTTLELPKPNKWGIWYDGAYLSTYQVCILLNEYVDAKKENEQLKQYIYDNIAENICEVCSYQYLEKHSQMQGYYVAKCKKGYDNCSKGTVIHCKDFKFKELNVND